MMKPGTNLYGLKELLAADYEGTMDKVPGLGFGSIEPLVFFEEDADSFPDIPNLTTFAWPSKTLLARIDGIRARGLAVPSCHVFVPSSIAVNERADAVTALAEASGMKTFVISRMISNEAGCEAEAKAFNILSEKLQDKGLVLQYHNHEVEFERLGNEKNASCVMDCFLEKLDPSVLLQLDVGWAAFAGADVVAFLNSFPDRIGCLHLKDFTKDFRKENRAGDMAAIGEGILDLKGIMAFAKKKDFSDAEIIFDQDLSKTDILLDLKRGVENCLRYLE